MTADRCSKKFNVNLRLFGPTLDPDQVSRVLGQPPTQSHRVGDVVSPASGLPTTHKDGFWCLTHSSAAARAVIITGRCTLSDIAKSTAVSTKQHAIGNVCPPLFAPSSPRAPDE